MVTMESFKRSHLLLSLPLPAEVKRKPFPVDSGCTSSSVTAGWTSSLAMYHQAAPLQPTPGAVTALFATSLILVLTPAAIGRMMEKHQTIELLHQDKNGAATIESQRRADATGRSACVQALTVGSVGLAMAAMGVLRETPTVFDMSLDTATLNFICWVLTRSNSSTLTLFNVH